MATQPVDVASLNTWEDAFQYPLPTVRKLEQQLRQNIEANRTKLRSLVGSSYRDLLGTAERIVDMDEQLQGVERQLGDLGRKCNVRRLDRVVENHERMKQLRQGGAAAAAAAVAAQTKTLQSALALAARRIKSREDALLVAKLLVLARLLHKSLAERADPPAVLEVLRRKLGQTRKRLLAYLARSLVRLDTGGGGGGSERAATTIPNLVAYSLITSSAPKDVLRYFLQIRFQRLVAEAETPTEGDLAHMLELYSQTLLDTRELFPRRFADSLFQLSKTALVRDEQVRCVTELGLDIYEQWIPLDVRQFTPWVRHDQLSASEVGDALASWTRQAQVCLLDSLRARLQEQTDAQVVLDTRQTLVSKYLSLSARLRDDGHMKTITAIRTIFLDRLQQMAMDAVGVADVERELQRSTDQPATAGTIDLWSLATDNLDLNGGAVKLRQAVLRAQNGRDSAVLRMAATLDAWMEKLHNFSQVIASMRASKWDDDLDVDLDDVSDGESIRVVLSKHDPQQLQSKLHAVTKAALQSMYSSVSGASERGSRPDMLIRVTREIDLRRQHLAEQIPEVEQTQADAAALAKWHAAISRSVAEAAMEELPTTTSPSQVAVSLWDGTPALPVQPSPSTFGFLLALHRAMAQRGLDLWSRHAVQSLKRIVAGQLAERLSTKMEETITAAAQLANGHEAADVNGGSANGDVEESDEHVNVDNPSPRPDVKGETDVDGEEAEATNPQHAGHDALLQQMFDVLYLQHVFPAVGATVEHGLEALGQELQQRVTLHDTARERLRKSAGDYWRRTYLLLGLLAPSP